MFGTQLLASATALIRGQILPPSEMKSLYGSITTSVVMPLSEAWFVMTSLQWSPWRRCLPRVAGKDIIAVFCGFVAGEAGFVQGFVAGSAVREVSVSPTTAPGILLRVLDHELNVHGRPGNERLESSSGKASG